MRSLGFAASGACVRDGKRIRAAVFERHSSLPTSAACVVANGVRETLSSLLGAPVTVRLFEPVIPDRDGWRAVVKDATLYRVRGSIADAALILRPADATALASALFGEAPNGAPQERKLSPIESTVIERTANAIAANFGAVCGARDAYPVERVGTLDGFVSFFELFVEKPAEARIGIALSRDPAPEPRGSLDVDHLAEVHIAAVAALHLGNMPGSKIAALSVGTIFPLAAATLRRCTLIAGGRRVARGTCGVRGGHYAIAVDTRENG